MKVRNSIDQWCLRAGLQWVLAIVALLSCGRTVAAADVLYSVDVAPLLSKYCLGCHQRAEAEGGLSLQTPAEIRSGGESGAVIDAENPQQSRLLQVLRSKGDDQMPPADQPQPGAEELHILEQWLLGGAAFDMQSAVRPQLPKMQTRSGLTAGALAAEVSGNGQLLVTGHFRKVRISATTDFNVLAELDVPDGKVTDVHFCQNDERVLVATGTPGLSGRALLLDAATLKVVQEYAGAADALYAAEMSPDGSLVATAGYDRTIRLYNTATGELQQSLTGHNGAVFDLDFSPDGSLLGSASADATGKIWHVATGERLDTLGNPLSEQLRLLFSPDGNAVYAVGADSRIRRWRLLSRTQAVVNPLQVSRFAHEGTIRELEITSDGQLLVTMDESGILKYWDAGTLTELAAEDTSRHRISSLAVDEQRRRVLLLSPSSTSASLDFPVLAESASANPLMLSEVVAPQAAGELQEYTEEEPAEGVQQPLQLTLPAVVRGVIHREQDEQADEDLFLIPAEQDQTILVEVQAARDNSPLDSVVEILTTTGQPILQAKLQAVRDSYFTFRGKDSSTSDDFRLFNWQEMDLNQYLYADGEVVKLWLYPRGPDSGFKVYPGFGSRQTYFNTTPVTHPLQGPSFIVVPYAPEQVLTDTGLPVFPVYAENDDDPMRQWGSDSRLMFRAPKAGDYLVRIRDARGFQGADYSYQLKVRFPAPDFSVGMSGGELKIHPGTGRELVFTATRLDGFEEEIEISAENLPAGFEFSSPLVIQREQRQAMGILIAANDAVSPTEEQVAAIRFVARGRSGEREIEHEAGKLKSLQVEPNPPVLVRVLSEELHAAENSGQVAELTVVTGQTTRAWLQVDRLNHGGLVKFGNEDSGRNMPHGVFVDNIGLNGLMLLEGQNEREVFITVADWVPEQSRPFYLKSDVGGQITSLPVMLHIRRAESQD